MKGIYKNIVIQAIEKLKRHVYCLKHNEFMEFANGSSIEINLPVWNDLDEKNNDNIILHVKIQESKNQSVLL